MSANISLDALLERLRNETGKLSIEIEQEIKSLWQWGIERIEDPAIKGTLEDYIFHRVPANFFLAPSSVTGNHHPYWHNRPGGLLRHITECCVSADRLISLFGYVNKNDKVDANIRDRVLAATVITDTQKNGVPWGDHTVPNHGEIAAKIWREVWDESNDPRRPSKISIAQASHWHYGRYTPVPDGEKRVSFIELNDITKIVHLLDACSSAFYYEFIYRPVDRVISPEEACAFFIKR